MNQTTINRYAPGGDLYQKLSIQYGESNAQAIYAAARTGNQKLVNEAFTMVAHGQPLDTNTWRLFMQNVAESAPKYGRNLNLALVAAGAIAIYLLFIKKG